MKYCLECGSKIEYTNKIPKFCGECGTPLDGASTASNSSAPATPERESRSSAPEPLDPNASSERGWDKDGLDVGMPDLSNFRLELSEKQSSSISSRQTSMDEISKEAPGIYDSSGVRNGIKRMDKEMKKK